VEAAADFGMGKGDALNVIEAQNKYSTKLIIIVDAEEASERKLHNVRSSPQKESLPFRSTPNRQVRIPVVQALHQLAGRQHHHPLPILIPALFASRAHFAFQGDGRTGIRF